MSHKWRWSLLGFLVAIMVGGLMPHSLLTGAETRVSSSVTTAVTWSRVEVPFSPPPCPEASCNRGVPSPAAPTLTVVAAAAMVGMLAWAANNRRSRRLRTATAVLPRGSSSELFRPPQFS